MARIGQEGLNNFLTDHLLRFLLGCVVRASIIVTTIMPIGGIRRTALGSVKRMVQTPMGMGRPI